MGLCRLQRVSYRSAFPRWKCRCDGLGRFHGWCSPRGCWTAQVIGNIFDIRLVRKQALIWLSANTEFVELVSSTSMTWTTPSLMLTVRITCHKNIIHKGNDIDQKYIKTTCDEKIMRHKLRAGLFAVLHVLACVCTLSWRVSECKLVIAPKSLSRPALTYKHRFVFDLDFGELWPPHRSLQTSFYQQLSFVLQQRWKLVIRWIKL